MKIAFYKGKTRLFNRFVSWWTRGPYSHCEAVFSAEDRLDPAKPMYCASSSFMDGGVRFKNIAFTPDRWDVIEVPAMDGLKALDWFHEHLKDSYDVLGLLATSTPIAQGQRKWFCNEAIGTAGGVTEAWRFTPNSFARLCEAMGGRWIQRSE